LLLICPCPAFRVAQAHLSYLERRSRDEFPGVRAVLGGG
jgi:hypothetical protein